MSNKHLSRTVKFALEKEGNHDLLNPVFWWVIYRHELITTFPLDEKGKAEKKVEDLERLEAQKRDVYFNRD